jgi:hypothetical protein
MKFWVSRNFQKYGPYSLDELKRMVAQGQAGLADWVWQEGTPQWTPLDNVLSGANGGVSSPPIVFADQSDNLRRTGFTAFDLIPPDIHWMWLVVLALPTLGIFPFIWFLRMTTFARKLAPDDAPMYLAIAGFVCIHFGNILRIAHTHEGIRHANASMSTLFLFGGIACYIVARFKVRRILLVHYNSVEPIGLYLSGAMTFFFGIYYLQYHFSRIAQWKRTGYLEPQ